MFIEVDEEQVESDKNYHYSTKSASQVILKFDNSLVPDAVIHEITKRMTLTDRTPNLFCL